MVRSNAKAAGIDVAGLSILGLRAMAATNTLEHEADIAKVQAFLGHSDIGTTRIYDCGWIKPADSPTFKIRG
ncbi:Tyrosine recombinase XerD [compost metagenome]